MIAFLAAAAVTHCPSASIGPGSLRRGGDAGANCMLAAYRDHCRAADYTLSSFGVDTIHTRTFELSGCRVVVTESFRVVPQPPHVLRHYTCTRIRKTPTDVVADRCSPQATLSLTNLG